VKEWRNPRVVAVALVVMAAGFGQFGAVAALADVAEAFGETKGDATIEEQAGLSGTALGIGLSVIRIAALGGLVLAGLADRLGRRRILTACSTAGLGLTFLASFSPTYWWFVAAFALGRPLFAATTTVAAVAAAEHTTSPERARAVALVAAAYGVGAGAVAVVRAISSEVLGFRGVFALALIPLVLLPFATRQLEEPERYRMLEIARERPIPVLGAVRGRHRGRLGVVAVVTFAVAAVTGPANSFVFVYAENVLGLSTGVTATLVVAAGLAGLVGLLIGRWGADRFGRRATAGAALAGLALAALCTYSGSTVALAVGYLLGVLAGSTYSPAMGSLVAELFPTPIRASVAGWLVGAGVVGASVGLLVFGTLVDVNQSFRGAAVVVFLPVVPAGLVLNLVPETRGHELDAGSGAK
jgi:MFS family permease